MNEEISNKFNGYFEVDETYENENWIRTKIRTFAFGKNRNGSDIINSSMSKFNKAQKSIGGIPIVAKYNTDKDDLEGHNVTLRENKDGEYEIYHDTNALGFTSPTSTFYTEEVNEGTNSSPNYKTYITIEDVYLWKRFDATKKILEWKSEGVPAKVSMEIDNVVGSFDKDGYFSISDFIFTGIAALGSDTEPCFPKAEIQLYTVNDFKADLKQLMYELTAQGDVETKGGNDLEETKQEFETTVETTETQVEEAQVETTEEVVVETEDSNENQEIVTEEFTEEVQTETVETVVEEAKDEVTEEVVEEFEVATITEEVTKTEVETTVTTIETEGDTTVDDLITKDKKDDEKEIIDFESKFKDLSVEFESLKVELEDLRNFKRETLEKELSAKFEGQLTDEELAQVFEQSKGSTIEDIEKELFALVGKKNFSAFSVQPTTKIAVNMNKEVDSTPNSPYGDLFKKHLSK